MEFTSIYKNGKPQNFFIKIENIKEFNFLQPYFLVTDIDHTRKGNIQEMNCLFSGSVWYGKARHGYGYSHSHDVYSTLIDIITTLYKNQLSDATLTELKHINTHDDKLTLSEKLLNELQELNKKELEKRYN